LRQTDAPAVRRVVHRVVRLLDETGCALEQEALLLG